MQGVYRCYDTVRIDQTRHTVPGNTSRTSAAQTGQKWLSRALCASFVLTTLQLIAPADAVAEPGTIQDRFEFSGFGTLGIARSDTNDARFVRDQTQPRGIGKSPNAKLDSLLGLQAYFRATDSLELVAQAISRYGAQDDFRPELSWAFAKYSITPNLTLRGGRMGTEFYMLADSRHVGYSYLTVRPQVDFFGALAFHHVDGADLTGTVALGDGIVKGKVFAGRANEVTPIGSEFFSLRGNPMAGGYLDYQQGNWQWRATFAQMTFKHDLPRPVADLRAALLATGIASAASAAEQIALEDTRSRFYSVGGVYDRGPLQVQAMLSRIRHESASYQDSQSGYVLAGYRLGQVTPFGGYSWTRSKAKEVSSGLPNFVPAFAQINDGLAGSLARVHTDQKTYTLGARWDFRQNMALKSQLDMIRGKPDSIFLYPTSNPGAFDGKLNILSLALDFVF